MHNEPHNARARAAFPENEYPHQALTGKIIEASMRVFRTLGYGFFETVC
jgi:hypothetical protein